jgi:hypothetical protein
LPETERECKYQRSEKSVEEKECEVASKPRSTTKRTMDDDVVDFSEGFGVIYPVYDIMALLGDDPLTMRLKGCLELFQPKKLPARDTLLDRW